MSIIFTTVSPILGGLIVVLNIFQLYCIRRIQHMKGRGGRGSVLHNNMAYIKSLCASDILAGVTMVVLKSMDPFMKTTLKDNVLAKETYDILRMVFIRFSMFISIFNLIAMTVDRYFSIFHPVKHRNQSRNFIRIVIGVGWGLSFFSVVLFYCITRWFVAKSSTGLVTLVFPILSYPATVVFVYCYTVIYMWIRQRGRTNIKSEVRFLKLASIVVLTFVFCWLPISTCQLVLAAGETVCVSMEFQMFIFTLAFANSLFNPIIYFLHARKKLKKCFFHRGSEVDFSHHSSSQNQRPGTIRELLALDTKM